MMEWAGLQQGRWPALQWLHHIPNGGARDAITGAKLKAEGVKPGVPDLCLPIPIGCYHGLYIELKRPGVRKPSAAQKEWLEWLAENGYCAALCSGCEEAIQVLKGYLENRVKKEWIYGA